MLRIIDNIKSVTPERLDELMARLPQWRRERTLKYKHLTQRTESALAFTLLQDMLAEEYGIRDSIVFDTNEHGKPSLKGHPDVHFNLSHCSRAVACVVADVPVGVDIECLGRYKERLAAYTLSPKELAELETGDRDLLFTVLWTKKEALLKLLGTGITDSLKTILELHDGRVLFDTTINRESGYVCTTARWK